MIRVLTVAATSLSLAACATTGATNGGPTEVMRYHLGTPIPPGTVTVEPPSASRATPEFLIYADATRASLARLGFTPAAPGTGSDYIAAVVFDRVLRGQVRTPPKFTIGLGGGSFGGNVGVGGGVSTGFGSKTRDVIGSRLTVQLRRRSDGTMLWEGNAQRTEVSGPGADAAATATRMADALFKGFPGESGITTEVP